MNDATRPQHLAARMAHIEAFEVMEIQTLARQVEAAGHDVIHVEIGEPDFTTPRPVVESTRFARSVHDIMEQFDDERNTI